MIKERFIPFVLIGIFVLLVAAVMVMSAERKDPPKRIEYIVIENDALGYAQMFNGLGEYIGKVDNGTFCEPLGTAMFEDGALEMVRVDCHGTVGFINPVSIR